MAKAISLKLALKEELPRFFVPKLSSEFPKFSEINLFNLLHWYKEGIKAPLTSKFAVGENFLLLLFRDARVIFAARDMEWEEDD